MKINEQLFPYFLKAGKLKKYGAKDVIYMQEDASNSLYLLLKGRVRVYAVLSTGDELTYEILEKGRIFGDSSFFKNTPRPTTVSCVNDVELVECQLDDLYPYLSQSKDLTIALLQTLSENCDHLTSLLKRAYYYDRYEKVASFLLEETKEDNPERGIFDATLPYTHEELAMVIGLSRVTTTKVLNKFKKKNYINLAYKKIQVIDRDGLKSEIKQIS